MRSRLAVPVAALLVVGGLAVPPAAAQTCAPPSAEHAFEELLDIAVDDSPLEEEAWRIADEQEAAGAFETAETLRMIDELARSNDLVWDCSTRRYVPVSHPDPRDAIENDEEPVYEGPTGIPQDGAQPAGGTTGPGSGGGSSSPGGSSSSGGSGGSVAAPPSASGADDGGVAPGSDNGSGSAAAGGGPGSGSGLRASDAAPSGSGERPRPRTGEQISASEAGTGGASGEEVAEPAGTPDGEGGAVALPAGEAPASAWPGLAALVAAALAGLAGLAGRRRHVRELT